ncbi:MAG: PQQ-dependent sugar dehydrogenase [Longimicrobiales bacterium]
MKFLIVLLGFAAVGTWSSTSIGDRSQRRACLGAGITVPSGFCAEIFADTVGAARHLAVAPNGDVYAALSNPDGITHIARLAPARSRSGLLMLRDTTGDGRADIEARIPIDLMATGIALRGNYVYYARRHTVERRAIHPQRFGVLGAPDTIVLGFPEGGHNAKSIAFGADGDLFVGVGSVTNACRASRAETAPDPCPELGIRAGIWRYDATRPRQRHPQDGTRWATGVRNGMGLYWHTGLRALFGTSHGRDGLSSLFPSLYTPEQNTDIPSEEFFRLDRGTDIGWPYCFHDRRKNLKVLAPEYGGDGSLVGRCARVAQPLVGFPGHWAPNALMMYTGTQFPTKYHDGAFIAFHGSWNRQPLPEDGYNVVFQPMRNGLPNGTFEIFADGFAEGDKEPVRAPHRPIGLAQGPDGSLFISDDQRGRIYRFTYR